MAKDQNTYMCLLRADFLLRRVRLVGLAWVLGVIGLNVHGRAAKGRSRMSVITETGKNKPVCRNGTYASTRGRGFGPFRSLLKGGAAAELPDVSLFRSCRVAFSRLAVALAKAAEGNG